MNSPYPFIARAGAPEKSETPAEKPRREPRRFLSLLTSEERKQYPVTTGFMDYFPDAMAIVSNVSWRGNNKHNPGQPLHWARGKSGDHADCQGRHMLERGALDAEGIEHMAQKAWRAMAELQEYMEQKYDLDLPRGATAPGVELPER